MFCIHSLTKAIYADVAFHSASSTSSHQCNIDIKRASGKLRTKANARFILEIYAPFFQGLIAVLSWLAV